MKLSGFYSSISAEGSLAGVSGSAGRENWFVGVSAPFGQWNFKASYGGTNGKDRLDNVDGTQWALGADYNLSKRTALYGTWSSISNDGGAAFSGGPRLGSRLTAEQELERRSDRRASHLLIARLPQGSRSHRQRPPSGGLFYGRPVWRRFVPLRGSVAHRCSKHSAAYACWQACWGWRAASMRLRPTADTSASRSDGLTAGSPSCCPARPQRSTPRAWPMAAGPSMPSPSVRPACTGVPCASNRGNWASVSFSWKVASLLPEADVRHSDTEDAVVRVLLAFDGDPGRLSPRTRMMFDLMQSLSGEAPPFATLMYVWDPHAELDSVVLNKRSDRIRKIVLESGPAHLGQWRSYERDVRADYRRAFGEEPGALIGVAVMTDSDNTQSRAEAWYGEIRLQ